MAQRRQIALAAGYPFGQTLFAPKSRAGSHGHPDRSGKQLKSEPRPPARGSQNRKRLPLSELTGEALLAASGAFAALGHVPEIKGYDPDAVARSALATVNAICASPQLVGSGTTGKRGAVLSAGNRRATAAFSQPASAWVDLRPARP